MAHFGCEGGSKTPLFKNDVYQGTDPAVIIITRRCETSCRTRTYCLKGDVESALSFLTELQRGHFHSRRTRRGSPKPEREDCQQNDESFHCSYGVTSNRAEVSLKISMENTGVL